MHQVLWKVQLQHSFQDEPIHPIRLLMCFGNQYYNGCMFWMVYQKETSYIYRDNFCLDDIESCNVSNIPSFYTVVSNHPRIQLFPMFWLGIIIILPKHQMLKQNLPPLFCWSMSLSSNYFSKSWPLLITKNAGVDRRNSAGISGSNEYTEW